jgi:plastocyanin
MMYRRKGDPEPAVHPDYEKAMQQPVVLDNKLCRFEPHALFVRSGQTLRLKNSDDVGHNCHITLFNNEANVNIPIGEYVDVKLKQPEKVPGNVVCDIHKWMDAVLLVRDEPYVAITDSDGRFEMANIPAGTWKFQFWHRRAGYMKQLQVPGMKTGRRGEIEVTIKDGETLDLGQLMIDGSVFKTK